MLREADRHRTYFRVGVTELAKGFNEGKRGKKNDA